MIEDFLNEHPMTSLVMLLVFATALVVAIVAVPTYYVQDYSCSKRAELLDTEHKFSYWTGCWIKDKSSNTWYEYTTVRTVEVK